VRYALPDWGVWSENEQRMLETQLVDLDFAKDRANELFAGDESVEVVEICPNHINEQKRYCREEH
jgi:hypothetical protein